jgi:hypothetical protein
MKRILSFMLYAVLTLNLHSQNLLVNPGFETWQKLNKPTGWTTALGCLKDSALILSGNYSCRQAATAESRELGQIISVTGGNLYRIAFWYRNETGETGNGCRLWSNWKDVEGNVIDDDVSLPLLHSGFLNSDGWKQYSADVSAPLTATHFNLIIRTLPNSLTYWDDIFFEEIVPTNMNEGCADNLWIYPNPATDYLNIRNMRHIQFIDILSITGIKILSREINGEESLMIPLAGFKDGIYIISLYGTGRRSYIKFMKTSDF